MRLWFETYQVPLVWAEQPPLSAEPVAQVRDVVPAAARARTNVAALESRLDVTVTEYVLAVDDTARRALTSFSVGSMESSADSVQFAYEPLLSVAQVSNASAA